MSSNHTIEIHNLSAHPRAGWTSIVVPSSAIAKNLDANLSTKPTFVFRTESDTVWRAVVGPRRGRNRVVHVRAAMDGGQVVHGNLVPSSGPSAPFAAHPWVTKAILDGQQVKVLVRSPSLDTELVPSWTIDAGASDDARIVARGRAYKNGWLLEMWAHVYDMDPVVPMFAKLIWQDFSVPDWNSPDVSVTFVLGRETIPVATSSMAVHGESMTTQLRFRPESGSSMPLLPRHLADEVVREAMAEGDSVAPSEHTDILGVYVGPRSWGALPRKSQMPARTDYELAKMRLNIMAGKYVLVCDKDPSRPGEQDDFGALAGCEFLSSSGIRNFDVLGRAVYRDIGRGSHYYVPPVDNEFPDPVRASRYPTWVTWRGQTHYKANVSRETWGKVVSKPDHGVYGHDEQHRSQNYVAAYLEIADDPAVHHYLDHLAEVDLADYRRRYPHLGYGSARAVGRTLQTWAHFYAVTGDGRWLRLIDALAKQSVERMEQLASKNGQKPLSIIEASDTRIELGVRNVSVWEHALAMIGVYAALQVAPSSDLHAIAQGVAGLLNACIKENPTNEAPQNVPWSIDTGVEGCTVVKSAQWGSGTAMWLEAGLMTVLRYASDYGHEGLTKAIRGRLHTRIAEWSDMATRPQTANWFVMAGDDLVPPAQA